MNLNITVLMDWSSEDGEWGRGGGGRVMLEIPICQPFNSTCNVNSIFENGLSINVNLAMHTWHLHEHSNSTDELTYYYY